MAEKKKTEKSKIIPISETKEEAGCRTGCCLKGDVLKKHLAFLGLAVILAIALGYFFRDRFLAAVVNGRPVFRYKLSQLLIKNSGKEALENLIVEGLIKDEVKKNQIVVTKEAVEGEIAKISSQFGDAAKFTEILSAQGMTLEDLRAQIETKLQVYGIIGKDIVVSDEEVNQYLKDNEKTLIATSEAERILEAAGALREQKISEKVQTWIADLLAKAKITRFLK